MHGLLNADVDLKLAAKLFAQHFATGASVTKNAQGFDEIVIQGDVAYEIQDMVENEAKQSKLEKMLKDVPVDNIDVVEEKKKKNE